MFAGLLQCCRKAATNVCEDGWLHSQPPSVKVSPFLQERWHYRFWVSRGHVSFSICSDTIVLNIYYSSPGEREYERARAWVCVRACVCVCVCVCICVCVGGLHNRTEREPGPWLYPRAFICISTTFPSTTECILVFHRCCQLLSEKLCHFVSYDITGEGRLHFTALWGWRQLREKPSIPFHPPG